MPNVNYFHWSKRKSFSHFEMKRESKNNDYLFDAIITMIITFVGPESSAGALTSAEPCQHTAADELVPFFAEHLGLFHKDRLLQTHDTSVKNGKLNMLQTVEQKQQIWYGKGWPPAWHSSSQQNCRGLPGSFAEIQVSRVEMPSGGTHLSPFI